MKPIPDWPEKLKKTRPRLRVLRALEDTAGPMSAVELRRLLERDGSMPLSTVYRVLETFCAHELVQKTRLMENGPAVYERTPSGHRHYAVCIGCRKVVPVRGCPLQHLSLELGDKDFRIEGHRLQLYGHCGDCAGPDVEK